MYFKVCIYLRFLSKSSLSQPSKFLMYIIYCFPLCYMSIYPLCVARTAASSTSSSRTALAPHPEKVLDTRWPCPVVARKTAARSLCNSMTGHSDRVGAKAQESLTNKKHAPSSHAPSSAALRVEMVSGPGSSAIRLGRVHIATSETVSHDISLWKTRELTKYSIFMFHRWNIKHKTESLQTNVCCFCLCQRWNQNSAILLKPSCPRPRGATSRPTTPR